MENEGHTSVPELFEGTKNYNYPCSIQDSLVPNEVEAKLDFGGRIIHILAPITKVDKGRNTIQIQVVGRVTGFLLIGLPGEVENAGATILVKESEFLLG